MNFSNLFVLFREKCEAVIFLYAYVLFALVMLVLFFGGSFICSLIFTRYRFKWSWIKAIVISGIIFIGYTALSLSITEQLHKFLIHNWTPYLLIDDTPYHLKIGARLTTQALLVFPYLLSIVLFFRFGLYKDIIQKIRKSPTPQ
jgi:hypothetical protein